MKKGLKFLFFTFLIMFVGGVVGYQQFILADYNYTGDNKQIAGVFAGDISIVGQKNEMTIQAGSKVEVVTVLGHDNILKIEPGAEVGRIRGAGHGNKIIAPENVQLDLSSFKGDNNGRQEKIKESVDGL